MIRKILNKLMSVGFSPFLSKCIVAQSLHETANFKSKLYKENNNLFGMKQPEIRFTLSRCEKNGYASFGNWEESVSDYVSYWSYQLGKIKHIDTIENFVKLLKKANYFEAKEEDYLKGVKYFFNKNFD
jgi:flagellum-specific peptidoglycan hydrolase FlgJ